LAKRGGERENKKKFAKREGGRGEKRKKTFCCGPSSTSAEVTSKERKKGRKLKGKERDRLRPLEVSSIYSIILDRR